MLSFALLCFDMVAYSCRLASVPCGFLHIVLFAYVRFGFLECGGFCIRFASGCCCCTSFLPFAFFCLFPGLPWFASFLLLGSEATVVFVGVSCGEPGGNEQMAHSQIVVVIAFSLTFEMDVALVLHRRPFGNVGFHGRFFNRRLLSFVSVCV